MSRLRVYARIARVLLVVTLGLSMASVFGLFERLGVANSMVRRQRWSRFFMARLSHALPFSVTVHGQLPQRPMLWVSNHVSWTDIPLLGMLTPMSFLSKAEVRTWPVAGWLAAKAGSLFIRRGSGDSQLIRKQMSRHLEQAHPLLMFPEGTTTDGRSCAPSTGACCRQPSMPTSRCNRWRSVTCATVNRIRWHRSLAMMICCRT